MSCPEVQCDPFGPGLEFAPRNVPRRIPRKRSTDGSGTCEHKLRGKQRVAFMEFWVERLILAVLSMNLRK